MERLNVKTMLLELTRECNLECKHCFRGDSQNVYMNTELIDTIFNEVCRINSLLLTGGEPLLAVEQLKSIRDNILKDMTNVGEVIVVTNGTVLSDEIISILKDISTRANLEIRLSTDAFHVLEIKRKNLQSTKQENIKKIYRNFGISIPDNREFMIDRVGRAVNLTSEDIDYINTLDNNKYILGNTKILEEYRSVYPLPILRDDNVVDGALNIDVYGNITPTYYSFEAEDTNRYGSIKNKSLKMEIKNIK